MYCQSLAEMEAIQARLAAFERGSKERVALLAELKVWRNGFVIAARELRLTVQHAIERQSTKAGESGSLAKDELIGGAAVRLKKVG